ncbi:long-chain fatty acid--CoA ligase [Cytophagaceae bacterium 50C-KIRBA]|uniref:Long-chain fatty acid--CoA ligase n=1 Tax=Aquirufa beregesia TaxID=2516556 RepID=A0ABX0EW64_9BACT|nr:acyl-CoA synthetase [Aquirufa beregesia]NGZ43608.1 long-chain fatty acid--CoA ligase [Aquirufa beregesia]
MLYFQQNARKFGKSIALLSGSQAYSYSTLIDQAEKIAGLLVEDQADLHQSPVAYMVEPGFAYVSAQWGIWLAGGIAVPVALAQPVDSIQYIIQDTGAKTFICSACFTSLLSDFCRDADVRLLVWEEVPETASKSLPEINVDKGAMILYTSGTTSLPKGVLSTHHGIESQIRSLVEAWNYTADDHTLCVLPLHHIHGIINVISATLYVGGKVEFLPQFSPEEIFARFKQGALNVFMAVPTIYFKLIAYLESLPESERIELKTCMQAFRLMISGSAALPVSVMEKWEILSGQRLLERYGMTEIGMAISNPYAGERRAGHVGMPLPGVQVRIVDEKNRIVEGQPGEIQIKGPTVFKEYWGKEKASQEAFTEDGWFKTGDVAELADGYYRILGRNSTDIIKSGGYKLSALEIEEVLRTHASVEDCSVVGLPDEEWGEIVAAAVVLKDKKSSPEELNTFMRQKMPAYRVPRKYLFLSELPRNAMGKVTKNDLKVLFT